MSILDFVSRHGMTLVIAAVVLFVLVRSLRIANQYERGVVFRLGKYSRTAGPGL
jgi:regulator of protease activity HflC (stomatin/prohibitin superfamily)